MIDFNFVAVMCEKLKEKHKKINKLTIKLKKQ